jgi:hypothetical protein
LHLHNNSPELEVRVLASSVSENSLHKALRKHIDAGSAHHEKRAKENLKTRKQNSLAISEDFFAGKL